jgi:hypothetical protein
MYIYFLFLFFQYHGGTNFGRTAGGPYITTSYDYDAPLDEYGTYINLELFVTILFYFLKKSLFLMKTNAFQNFYLSFMIKNCITNKKI